MSRKLATRANTRRSRGAVHRGASEESERADQPDLRGAEQCCAQYDQRHYLAHIRPRGLLIRDVNRAGARGWWENGKESAGSETVATQV